MKYFYYINKAGKEYAYQDEEVKRDEAQKLAYEARTLSKSEPTKQELVTEIATHKLEYTKEVIDSKTKAVSEVKEEVLASGSDVVIRWDGISPYYELISGVAPETVPFLGWPQVSKENYVEPVVEPVPDIIDSL